MRQRTLPVRRRLDLGTRLWRTRRRSLCSGNRVNTCINVVVPAFRCTMVASHTCVSSNLIHSVFWWFGVGVVGAGMYHTHEGRAYDQHTSPTVTCSLGRRVWRRLRLPPECCTYTLVAPPMLTLDGLTSRSVLPFKLPHGRDSCMLCT